MIELKESGWASDSNIFSCKSRCHSKVLCKKWPREF